MIWMLVAAAPIAWTLIEAGLEFSRLPKRVRIETIAVAMVHTLLACALWMSGYQLSQGYGTSWAEFAEHYRGTPWSWEAVIEIYRSIDNDIYRIMCAMVSKFSDCLLYTSPSPRD